MPPLTIPHAAPLGDVRDLQRDISVAPRADYVTGQQRSSKADQLDAQAIQSDISGAGEEAGLGADLAKAGEELMKPLEKLRMAREVMQATDISTRAALAARDKVQALKTSGLDYTEWLPTATKDIDELFTKASESAKKVSVAAHETVFRELQQERLSLLTGVSRGALTEDIDRQKGIYFNLRDKSATDYFNQTGLDRVATQDKLMNTIDVLEHTNILSAEEAANERKTWRDMVDKNTAIELALNVGIDEARKYIDANPRMLPDARRTTFNAAEDAVREDLQAAQRAAVAVEKSLRRAQDVEVSKYMDSIRVATNVSDLRALEFQLTADLATRAIDSQGEARIRTHIDSRVKEMLNPIPGKDNEALKTQIIYQIAFSPKSVDLDALQTTHELTPETKNALIPQLASALQQKHFSHTMAFKQFSEGLRSALPPESQVAYTPTGKIRAGTPQEEAVADLTRHLMESSAGTKGVLTEEEVIQYGQGRYEFLKKQLMEMKAVVPTTGTDFDSLRK